METTALMVQSVLALTIAIDAFLCVFIASNRTTRYARARLYLSLYIASILGWALATLIALTREAAFAVHGAYVAALALSVSKHYFALSFPRARTIRWYEHGAYLFLALAGIVVALVPGGVFVDFESVRGSYVRIVDGPFAVTYSIIILFFLLFPLVRLFLVRRDPSATVLERAHAFWLLLGMGFFFVVGILTNSVLPVFFDIYSFNGIGPTVSLSLALLITYIITRYHFLDLAIVVQRSVIYATLFGVVGLAYMSALSAVGALFTTRSSEYVALTSGFLTALFGALTMRRLDTALRRITNPWFFGYRYDYARALRELIEITNINLTYDAISLGVSQSLRKILQASFVRVIPAFTDSTVHVSAFDPAHITVPCELDSRCLAVFELGEKRSGEPYTPEDISLLTTFSKHCALAFEKARLFAEVEAYSRELEHKVERRTRTIVTLQEQQNQTLLDLAHRLQDPLTVARAELATVTDRTHAHTLGRTIEEMTMFVKGILALAHIDASSRFPIDADTNLTTTLRDLVEYYDVLARDSRITLITHIADGLVVRGEPERVAEALTNLVANAMKYMRDEPMLERIVEIRATQDNNDAVVVVRDNGIGIAPADLPRVFDRFFRATTHSAHAVPGTGLGLSITKRIIESCGGTICVDSTLGAGTTVTIRLAQPHQDSTIPI